MNEYDEAKIICDFSHTQHFFLLISGVLMRLSEIFFACLLKYINFHWFRSFEEKKHINTKSDTIFLISASVYID